MPGRRMLVHFSCGAASAVAWKVCAEAYRQRFMVEAVYADMSANEHPDNSRFMADVERWVGGKVTLLRHPKYRDIDSLFLDQRFMAGNRGAICTKIMKRQLRERYQRPDDVHVFGLTADEHRRIAVFKERNSDLSTMWPLLESGITKEHCYKIIDSAGIELPMMYRLGYSHNNCIGCVKGGMGYWNKIRKDFPEVFAKRAAVQREIGESAAFGSGGKFMLDVLDPEAGNDSPPENIECGVFCLGYADQLTEAIEDIKKRS